MPHSLPRRRAVLLAVSLLALPTGAGGQETGAVSGRVLDRQTLAPVQDVVVRIAETSLATTTDAAGRFEIRGVPAGPGSLVLGHVAYGEHTHPVSVEEAETLQVEVLVSAQVVELAPLLVEAMDENERRRVTSGFGANEIRAADIDEAARRGLDLGELLRQEMTGIRVRPARSGGDCVEYRGGAGSGSSCREVAVFVDGVRASVPSLLYGTMPLTDLERIELLSPGEAGSRYGSTGGWGVLLIETKRGIARRPRSGDPRLVSGFDWASERDPYPWLRVFGGAVLGNATGLGLGWLVADRCLLISDQGAVGLRSRCGALPTMAAGFLALGLPAIGGGLGGGWAGGTERSRGRLVPAAVMGSLTVTTGYLLVVHGESHGGGAARTAGMLVLALGTPMVTTLADRVFRRLR